MATVSKRLCKGVLGAANATLYTVPAATATYVKAITLCNKTASDVTATIKLASIEVVCTYTIFAYGTITIPFLDQIMEAAELIEGSASAADSINYYISGKEVA